MNHPAIQELCNNRIYHQIKGKGFLNKPLILGCPVQISITNNELAKAFSGDIYVNVDLMDIVVHIGESSLFELK